MNEVDNFLETEMVIGKINPEENTPSEKIAYLFDPKEIVSKARKFLDDLIRPEINQKISELPKKIDWTKPEEFEEAVTALIDSGGGESIISMLPDEIDFQDLNVSLVGVLGKLLDNGFVDQIVNKLKKISSFEDLSSFEFRVYFLKKIISHGLIDNVIDLLPDFNQESIFYRSSLDLYIEIAKKNQVFSQKILEQVSAYIPERINGFNNIFYGDLFFFKIALELDSDFESNFFSRIKGGIDVLLLKSKHLDLLSDLIKKGLGRQISESIQLTKEIQISAGVENFLITLIEAGFGQKVFNILEVAIDNKQTNSLSIATSLIEHGYAKEILDLDLLPNEMYLNLPDSKSEDCLDLLLSLIDVNCGDRVIKIIKFPNSLNLIKSPFVINLLNKLIDAGFHNEIVELMPKNLNLNNLNSKIYKVLAKLATYDQQIKTKLLASIPDKFYLADVRSAKTNISLSQEEKPKLGDELIEMIKGGLSNEIASRFQGMTSMDDLSYEHLKDNRTQIDFLIALAKNGNKEKLQKMFSELFKDLENKLRLPISYKDLSLNQKLGPHLNELMELLPIDKQSIQKKNGWFIFSLKKNGFSSAENFIYIKIADSLKVVFRNNKIGKEELSAYELAFSIINEYVSGMNYPELISEEVEGKNMLQKSEFGFREVYAGVSLSKIRIELLPPKIKESIELQKKYILLKLAVNGVDHGHPHDDNFNVRFLVQDNEKKQIFFDINMAIQHAIQHESNLTPILVLRDWDMSNAATH